MPVVTVTAPPPAGRDSEPDPVVTALRAVATAVAAPLGLAAADVHVVHVPAGACVVGDRVAAALPVVTLHGRRRTAAASAASGAGAAVAQAWSCTAKDVWVQWLFTD